MQKRDGERVELRPRHEFYRRELEEARGLASELISMGGRLFVVLLLVLGATLLAGWLRAPPEVHTTILVVGSTAVIAAAGRELIVAIASAKNKKDREARSPQPTDVSAGQGPARGTAS